MREGAMKSLANQFQDLINQGVIVGSADAPRIEPFARHGQVRMRTVYNLGDTMIRERLENAKLDAGSGRNPDARR